MHWGVRKDGKPQGFQYGKARSIHKEASRRIEEIAGDVVSAVKKTSGKMYGLENRLKTEESIARKIKSKGPNRIKDAIRFTTISPDDDFVSNYEKLKSELGKKGYKETECKNYFDEFRKGKVKHKAVQSNFATKDGYEFEIQFHTKASQDVKTKKIPLYEEVRTPGISKQRAAKIEKQMEDMANKIPDPKDIYKIKSH